MIVMSNKTEILFNNKCIMTIPNHLSYLAEEIQSSTYMLSYQDNWDDESSFGYTINTWQKAINLLLLIADFAYKNYEEEITIPDVFHGKKGGIDFLIENQHISKLIRLDKNISIADYCILRKLKPSEVIAEGEYLEPYSTIENLYLFFKKS